MINTPSLDHLKAFEAAGRNLSFKAAAEELNVTPAAVGQRVRVLEQQLKTTLFLRKTRQILLTNEGILLLADVQAGLELIEKGISRIKRSQLTNTLTVSTTNSFAELCLLPRLPEFSALYPDVNVRIMASDKRVDFARDNVDVAIRFGRGSYPDFHVQKLLAADYVPVCAPGLVGCEFHQMQPEDAENFMLIDTDWPAHQDVAPSWKKLFSRFGREIPATTKAMRVSIEAHAVKAALNGQGIALVQHLFVQDALADGSLVQIMGKAGTITPEFRYDLVWPQHDESTICRQFREWLSTRLSSEETGLYV